MAGRTEQESGLWGCTSLKYISLAPLKPRHSLSSPSSALAPDFRVNRYV